jgi:protein-S-isoprenylcysteine O-methyltransferase Ste14
MRATAFEYRFRFWIHALIYILGFTAPWLYWPALTDALGLSNRSTWLVLASLLARQGWLGFSAAAMLLVALALLFTGLGAWLRVWGTAYVGSAVVQSSSMHAAGATGTGMLADGPYRRTRNPLYLGTLLHTIGVAILMPPSGAVFAIALLWIFQVRLALAEEPFLAARFGQPYLQYLAETPRFLPAPTPQAAAAGNVPHWGQALLGEIYFVGVFLTLAIFGWSFNAQPLRRGLLISLGIALIARAFLSRPVAESINAAQ